MASVINSIVDYYTDIMDNRSDPRLKDWFLMSGPFPTIAICISYAIIVKIIGPKLMENRKPFELKNTLIVYNAFQVLLSAYLFRESIHAGWFTTYSFRCQPVDYSTSPHAMRVVAGCYLYYLSKFTEFFDTFFFVLRKKNDQVSRLHVIHHGVMPFSSWVGLKFTPGGHSTFFGMLNTLVHIVMYTYYLLSAFGPKMQKYLWWKKYLTTFQMVQFVLVTLHAFQLLFIECDYPKAFVWWIGLHAVMFYFLFKDFYDQTYNKKRKSSDTDKGPAAAAVAIQNGNAKANGKTVTNGEAVTNGKSISNGTSANGKHQNGNAKIYTNGNAKVKNGDIHETNGFINNESIRNRSNVNK